MTRRAELRILVVDVSDDAPANVFVTRRELGLYYARYRRPPGAEVIQPRQFTHAYWCSCAMCRDGVTELVRTCGPSRGAA